MIPYRLKDLFRDGTDVIIVNFLFWFTSLLGVFLTTGMAFKASYAVMYKLSRRQSPVHVWFDFFQAFKNEWKFTTLVWGIAVMSIVLLEFVGYFALASQQPFVAGSAITSIYLTTIALVYFFSMIAIFNTQTRLVMIKNVIVLIIQHPFLSLILPGPFVLSYFLWTYWSGTILFSMGIAMLMQTIMLRKVFSPYWSEFESAEEDSSGKEE